MPTKAGIVEDPFKDEGGAKNMLFGQPWWRGLSNNGVSPTSASNDSSARSSSGEPVNGSALAGNFSVPLNGIQDAGGNAGREIQTVLATQLRMHLFLYVCCENKLFVLLCSKSICSEIVCYLFSPCQICF